MDYLKGSAPIEQLLGTYQPSEGEDQNSNIFGDIGTGLKQGVTTDLAHTVTGLVDLAGSAVGADVSATAAADKAGLADLEKSYYNELTPETKEALRKVEEADGFWGTLGAYASNPRAIAYDVARALPMSLAGGGLGAAGAKGAAKLAGTATAKNAVKKELLGSTSAKAANYWAAGGEGLVGAGMSASSIAQYNAANPETRNPLEGVGYAALTGLGTGLVAGAAGRIGGSVESAVFNKSIRETMANKPWASVGKSAVTEGLEEAAQAPTETVPQNWAEDKPWNEDLGQNIAQSLIAGSAMGGGAHGAMRALRFASPGDGRPQVSQEPVDVNQAASGATMSMEGATPVEAQMNSDIETLAAEVARKRDEAKAKKAAKAAPVVAGTIQQRDQVVPVQNVASAKVAPTQVVPVAAALPGPGRVKPGIDRPADPDGMEVPTKAELRAAKKKAQEEADIKDREDYARLFTVKSDSTPQLKRYRRIKDKEGFVPAARAIVAAEAHVGSGQFDNHYKQIESLEKAAAKANTPEEFATWYENTAKEYQGKNQGRADTLALVAKGIRNPDKPMAELEREIASDEFTAISDSVPTNVPTYNVNTLKAKRIPGKARFTVDLDGEAVTLLGTIDGNKNFHPDTAHFKAFADFKEGRRANHKDLYDKVVAATKAKVIRGDEAKETTNGATEAVAVLEDKPAKKASPVLKPTKLPLTIMQTRKLMRDLLKSKGADDARKAVRGFDEAQSDAYVSEMERLIRNDGARANFTNTLTEHQKAVFAALMSDEAAKVERTDDARNKWQAVSEAEIEEINDSGNPSAAKSSSDDLNDYDTAQRGADRKSTTTEKNDLTVLETTLGDVHSGGNVGGSIFTNQGNTTGATVETRVKNNISRLLAPIANMPANQDKKLPTLIFVGGRLTQDSYNDLENTLRENAPLADAVKEVLTSKKAVDAAKAIEIKRNAKGLVRDNGLASTLVSTANKIEELAQLVGINDSELSYELMRKSAECYGQKMATYDEYIGAMNALSQGHEEGDVDVTNLRRVDLTAVPIAGKWLSKFMSNMGQMDISVGDALFGKKRKPVYFVDFATIREIQAKTPAGKEIQKDSFYVVDSDVDGVAVPLKSILEKAKNPTEDLKGLFSDDFVQYIIPAVERVRRNGRYAFNDNIYLVDGSHSAAMLRIDNNTVVKASPRGGAVTTFLKAARVLKVSIDGMALPTSEKLPTGSQFLRCDYTGSGSNFSKTYTAFHECGHVVSRSVGQEVANAVIKKHEPDLRYWAGKLQELTTSDLNGYTHGLESLDSELKELKQEILYPFKAAVKELDKGAGKEQAKGVFYKEMYATLFGLFHSGGPFTFLLQDKNYTGLANIVREVLYVASSSPDLGTSGQNHRGQLQGSGNRRSQDLYSEPGRVRGGRSENSYLEREESGQAARPGTRNADRHDDGNSEGQGSGKEVPQNRGLTVKTQKLVDRYIAKLPAHIRPFAENLSHKLFTSGLGLFFTRDICNMAYDATGIKAFKKLEETHQKLDDVRNTRMKEISAVLNKSSKLPKKEREVVGEYILDATLNEAWGYAHKSVFKDVGEYIKHVAKLDETHRKAEQTMRKRFNALSEAQQEVVKDYFETGVRELNTQLQLLKEKLDARRMPAVAEAEGKEIDEIEESPELKRIRHDIEHLQKYPYAPLMRAGTHMVIVKSPAYKKAERDLEVRSKAFNQMKEKDKEDREWLKEARDNLEKLKASPDDYIVEFVNGAGTAREVGDRYRGEMPGADIVVAERIEQLQSEIPGYQQIERWANVLAKNIEDGTVDELSQTHARALANELKKVLGTLYIRSLADNSAKKRQLKRRNVKGFNRDVFQNLAAAAPSSANLLAYTRYSDELADNIREIGTEVKKLRGDARMTASEFQNELIRRENMIGKQYNDFTNGIMRFTSMWMLLGNPAFYIQNLTQPFMMSAPYMAARHGFDVYKKFGKTCVEVFKLMKSDADLSKLEKMMNDPKVAPKDKPLTMDEWRALDHARRHGHLDIGITQDFGDAIRSDNKAANVAFGVTEKLTKWARVVEMYNRVATFLVAYRLEKAKGNSEAAAGAYADEVIYQTHGDYSAFNAPRWFGMTGLHRIATQFRKFQLIQAGLMIRLAANSFKGATPEIKAEARKQLLYIMSTYFAATGLKGMPFVFALMPAFALGDEGDDDEDVLRKAIGDKQLADFLVRGIPAGFGLDVSGKVGAENMLSLMPYTDAKFSDGRAGANSLLAGALGPSASLVQRFYTGMQYFAQGDNWKAIEQLTPGIVSNSLKGYRIATEGFTTKAGDQVLKPEDYDFGDAITQALGFQPRVMTDRMRVQDSLIRHKESFDADKNRIYMDFKKARREGDHAGMNQARREMLKLAAEARKQGLTGYTIQNMINAANEQRRRERQAVGGVGTNKNDRQFVKKMSEV